MNYDHQGIEDNSNISGGGVLGFAITCHRGRVSSTDGSISPTKGKSEKSKNMA